MDQVPTRKIGLDSCMQVVDIRTLHANFLCVIFFIENEVEFEVGTMVKENVLKKSEDFLFCFLISRCDYVKFKPHTVPRVRSLAISQVPHWPTFLISIL